LLEDEETGKELFLEGSGIDNTDSPVEVQLNSNSLFLKIFS